MKTVILPYKSNMYELTDWLCDNGHGPYKLNHEFGVLVGSKWRLYHTTENYRVVTKAEFDNEELAAIFALRWLE